MEQRTGIQFRIRLVERTADEETPPVAAYLLDRTGRVTEKIGVAKEDRIEVDRGKLKDPLASIAFGPDVEELSEIPKGNLLRLRVADHEKAWAEHTKVGVLVEIERELWHEAWTLKTCVSGRVRRCRGIFLQKVHTPFDDPHLPPMVRCKPVCRGVVEVWAHTCCKYPIEVEVELDPGDIVFNICQKFPWLCGPVLEDICKTHPEICDGLRRKWPDLFPEIGPHPKPELTQGCCEPPVETGVSVAGGGRSLAATCRKLRYHLAAGNAMPSLRLMSNLRADVYALLTLPSKEDYEYVKVHPRLWKYIRICHDGKLGETALEIDGRFRFCWNRFFRRPPRPHCHTTYFYKVKQKIHGHWVYIYNGSEEGEYFSAAEFADLTTYLGYACGEEDDSEYPKPFVKFEEIGWTDTWNLYSNWLGHNPVTNHDLTQISDDSLAPPPSNGGLANPPSPAGASGLSTIGLYNRPWGKTLMLRLKFHHDLKNAPIAAKYYRISIARENGNGHPVPGSLRILQQPVSWTYDEYMGGEWIKQSKNLGPHTISGGGATREGLYEIPYYSDALWDDNQFHGVWPTTEWSNGRHLLYVEIFDAAGNPLTPVTHNFVFLRRMMEFGVEHQAEVPFKKLAHLIWVDNRPVYGDIVDLRQDHNPNPLQCQFMHGTAASLFSVGFRAFHASVSSLTPPETFMWYYYLWCKRGLNGVEIPIEQNTRNKPTTADLSLPVPESNTRSFGVMLGGEPKCTFAVNLWVYAKHTNGFHRIDAYDYYEQASFALEQ
ncbi:hypothetical protein KKH27_00555 [bacterium]|nr:hypothetical protein [bacterium]